MTDRAPRLTRAAIQAAEIIQGTVILELQETGHPDLALCLARCQHNRQHRGTGWPWRCRSAGCWACRRCLTTRWWLALNEWIVGPERSLLTIPIEGELIQSMGRLRKGLRDVRDRQARLDHQWRDVALVGLLNGEQRSAMVLMQHTGITPPELWDILERRWPDVTVANHRDTTPSSNLKVEDAVALAERRRGIEPLRVIILPQRVASIEGMLNDAMPSFF